MTACRSRCAAGAVLVLLTACAAQPPTRPAPPSPAPAAQLPPAAAIDTEVRRLMAAEDVKGLALAVIDGGRVTHVAAYGRRNVERDLPLETRTVMSAASFTKTAFACMVLMLVDEGRIDLDASIAKLLPRPLPEYGDYADLAGDERWRLLTPRVILAHGTGFANFRRFEDDRRLRFHWDPGTRYGYSGEGIEVLQFVLEQGLGLDVGAEMQRRLFDRFGMTDTSMRWRADFANNVADGYAVDGAFVPHDRRPGADAAGSMDTTIADQARLWRGLLEGEGLSKAARADLVRPQLAIVSAHQFPTLGRDTDPRAATIGLAAGLGLITFTDAGGPMWFKGGHDDGTGNMVVCQEAQRRCVVLMANSVRAEMIYPDLVRFILGDTAMPWWWEYNR